MSSNNLQPIKGINFSEENLSLEKLVLSLQSTGGQASEVSKAIEILQEIEDLRQTAPKDKKPFVFLCYTSNMISSGIRELICHLAKHNHIDVMITTTGGIEEDFMKCEIDSKVVDYQVNDLKWRIEGKCRIGNMAFPVSSYGDFEEICEKCMAPREKEEKITNTIITPSELIKKLSEFYQDESSVYFWCAKNNIPVFCPGITDGAIGDNTYVRNFDNDEFVIDVNSDLTKICDLAVETERPLAAIVLGGSIPKYHGLNAIKLGGGADYYVCVTSGAGWDQSQSGAEIEQDISRGAIKEEAKCAIVRAEATLVFPQMAFQVYGLK